MFVVALSVTLCMLEHFTCFFVFCGFFSKKDQINFLLCQDPFDPDQARNSVRPDLGPNSNCLKRLSPSNKNCYFDKSHHMRGEIVKPLHTE